jgi:hypothetical protein
MRLPLIPPAKLDAAQRPLYEDMKNGIEKISRASGPSPATAR